MAKWCVLAGTPEGLCSNSSESCGRFGEMSVTQKDSLLPLSGSVEVPVVQRQSRDLCLWELWAFCFFEKQYVVYVWLIGKLILACLPGKVAGPSPPVAWFNWELCQAYYVGYCLEALWVNKERWSQIIIYTRTEWNIKITLKIISFSMTFLK